VVVAVDVAVAVAVAVAGHSGRSGRGGVSGRHRLQSKDRGHRERVTGTSTRSDRKGGAQSRPAYQQVGSFEEAPANSGQQLARV
jgi:hypothetical protein